MPVNERNPEVTINADGREVQIEPEADFLTPQWFREVACLTHVELRTRVGTFPFLNPGKGRV